VNRQLGGYPPRYARDDIPTLDHYPDGTSTPTPSAIDFTPGEISGVCRETLVFADTWRSSAHVPVVTSDKEGEGSTFEKELVDADVVISQPYWPAYLTEDRIAKAQNLKLAVTAGIGSDHVDLNAAIARGITVAEVTWCNSISVSEHAVMQILALVRNFVPSHGWASRGGWNIADCVERSYDLEGMNFGVLAGGRIGLAVLRRLAPFDVHLHYSDKRQLPADIEQEIGLTFHSDARSLAATVDVPSIHSPLVPETYQLFNDELPGEMKRASYIVNTARGAIMDRDAVVRALESGHLAGYAGDVWYPQPPPEDHPWR
jgi:formate dehydrogenase